VLNEANTASTVLSAYERWELPALDEGAAAPVVRHALKVHDDPPAARRKPNTPAQPEPEPEIRPPTAEELEAIRQAAYDEGLESGQKEGFKQGFDKGMASGQAEIRAIATRMRQICRSLLEPIPAQDEALEQALLELLKAICTRVVRRELLLDSRAIREIVREAIDCLRPATERIRIHLNPADAEQVTRELTAIDEQAAHWRILPHANISPGGCIVENDASLVDMRAEKRLTALIRQVYDRLEEGLAGDEVGTSGFQQVLDEVPGFELDDEESADPL
jgi:flagellar assembly protein FliH